MLSTFVSNNVFINIGMMNEVTFSPRYISWTIEHPLLNREDWNYNKHC